MYYVYQLHYFLIQTLFVQRHESKFKLTNYIHQDCFNMYLNLGLMCQLSLALYQSSRTQLLQNLHLTFMTRVLVSLQIRQITLHRLLIKNLGIENPLDSLTYRRVYPEDINERGVWGIVNLFGVPFGISANDEELDISSLYRIPKLHMRHKTALYCWVCQLLYKTSSKIICGMNLALRFL